MPSRVIHIRKLPNDISEAEVISLGLPFGDITNLLMLKAKNQVRDFQSPRCDQLSKTLRPFYNSCLR